MNILVIGSGGREHSLCWKIAQSPMLDQLYVAPGNGGMGEIAKCINLNAENHDEIVAFCNDNNISLVIIGPEAPLVDGLSDRLISENIKTFGPSSAAAILEGSKGFTKDLNHLYIASDGFQEGKMLQHSGFLKILNKRSKTSGFNDFVSGLFC